jgi:hypothetical protein
MARLPDEALLGLRLEGWMVLILIDKPGKRPNSTQVISPSY